MRDQLKVAVIGAGASGLASAREFRDRGHEVLVFEQGQAPGGVWAYAPEVEDDLLGLNPRQRVYSSLYEDLRTNLPSDLMAFKGFPFDASGGGEDSWPRFPHHTCVKTYLDRFARQFELLPLIQLGQRVVTLSVNKAGAERTRRWQLETEQGFAAEFDAVAICSGHFSEPRVPSIPGLSAFTGKLLHSHNYRRPHDFEGEVVAVLGRGASGSDIVQALAGRAKQILWAGFDVPKDLKQVKLVPFPERISAQGFHAGGEEYRCDTVLFCTGYRYELPFLTEDVVSINDNYVSPLYLDILPPHYPDLALIGLPFLVVPFPLYAMQAKWFAASLDREFTLPSKQSMLQACTERERLLRSRGLKQRHFHRIADEQEDYYNRLAQDCGAPKLPAWFGALAQEAQTIRQAHPSRFRDMPLEIPRQVHR